MEITIINCGRFEPVLANGLTPLELIEIKAIKDTFVSDEYAGYSPTEQNKYKQILTIVGTKIVKPNKI